MISDVLVVAPHPDDETLGCGATLLKLKAQGKRINWLIVTTPPPSPQLPKGGGNPLAKREAEICAADEMFGFSSVHRMKIPTTKVDMVPTGELVGMFSEILKKIEPDTLLLPYCNDAHTDHFHVARAVLSCCKWFRHPYIKNIAYYETISETDFNLNPADRKINPDIFVDVEEYFYRKLDIMKIYSGEMGEFPFPRSVEAIESLARLHGSQCGAKFAEAFELIRSVI